VSSGRPTSARASSRLVHGATSRHRGSITVRLTDKVSLKMQLLYAPQHVANLMQQR
uniref:Uncharacterized protein n=1 Tax=Aegilops tauschii subsp. strangulata TaxID=200361 RepID=A0A453GTM7_AEGTS